jgi:hypothetical protein
VEKGGVRASSIIKRALFTALRGMISTEMVEMEKINQNVGLYLPAALPSSPNPASYSKKWQDGSPNQIQGANPGCLHKGGGVTIGTSQGP